MSAHIDPAAVIGEDCQIGHNVVIEGDAHLGNGVQLGHNVVVHAGTVIGDNVVVEANAVLGRRPQPAPTSVNRAPADLPPLRIGEGCMIGAGAVIYHGTTIGRQCLIADLSFVREDTVIGDYVIVGAHVTVENRVQIGDYTKIQTGAYITAATTIEEHVFIAPGVITTNDNYMGRTEERFKHWGGPMIRCGARVGAGVTLLPTIEVGEETFVAAGSVVTHDAPPKMLVMGTPARPIRPVPSEEFVRQ